MNRVVIYILLMICGVGCSQPEGVEGDLYPSQEVIVRSEITSSSRVVADEWESGDEIGIFMTYANMPMVIGDTYNIQYATTSGDGVFSPVEAEEAIYYPHNQMPVDMYAYSPHSSSVTESGVVELNLSSIHQKYSQSSLDLMLASSKYIEFEYRDDEVIFSFDHQLAKLQVLVYPGADIAMEDLEGMTVQITSQATEVECNIFSREITPAGGDPTSIELNSVAEADRYITTALLVPQTASGDCKLQFSISSGESFSYSLSGVELRGGENRIYNFSLNHKRVEYISSNIEGWSYLDQSGAVVQYHAIRDEVDLISLRDKVNIGSERDVNVILMNDITLTESCWTPIGTSMHPFTGLFDGNGKSISGLNIDSPKSINQGLFGVVGDGVTESCIARLTLRDPLVKGGSNCGALAGMIMNTTIVNCTTEGGSVMGADYLGGVVGMALSSILTSCSSSATVSGEGSNVGDIAGLLRGSTVIE